MKSGDTMQIKWTVSALNDLDSEMDYLSKEASKDIAKKAYNAIQEKVLNLINCLLLFLTVYVKIG